MRFLLLSLGIALAVVVAPSASAQETATALPDWAAPGPPPSYTSEAAAASAPPNPPSAPAQVPLDGGLGLLALAGGVYAARRLRARGAEGA